MVDNDIKAGRQAVERAAAARESSPLGPGTAGHTIAGAAYRGQEVAVSTGSPGPAEPGFTNDTGLGYNDSEEAKSYRGYSRAEDTGE
jgi:hypothetical protein